MQNADIMHTYTPRMMPPETQKLVPYFAASLTEGSCSETCTVFGKKLIELYRHL